MSKQREFSILSGPSDAGLMELGGSPPGYLILNMGAQNQRLGALFYELICILKEKKISLEGILKSAYFLVENPKCEDSFS